MEQNSVSWQHPVRARLKAGEVVLGVTITTPSIEAAALAATLGFHFLWVEMEHSPITLETLRNIVLATRALPAAVFARVPVVELWTAKRVMDQGVSGVIFPFGSSPELAQKAVSACRYPPHGRRGSGAGLATFTWPDPHELLRFRRSEYVYGRHDRRSRSRRPNRRNRRYAGSRCTLHRHQRSVILPGIAWPPE